MTVHSMLIEMCVSRQHRWPRCMRQAHVEQRACSHQHRPAPHRCQEGSQSRTQEFVALGFIPHEQTSLTGQTAIQQAHA